jgi:hypothetical protein
MAKSIRSEEGPINPDFTAENAKNRKVDPEDVPDGTAAEVIEWVSQDKARAAAALKSEGKDGRTGLVNSLEKIVNEDTGAGIASGEV